MFGFPGESKGSSRFPSSDGIEDPFRSPSDRWLEAVTASTESLNRVTESLVSLQAAIKGASSALEGLAGSVRTPVTPAP